MIQLQDLMGFDTKAIVDLLLEQKKQPFEIYIPKSTQRYFSEPSAIALDYAYLAYSGHLLKEISDNFEYEFVLPEDHESILFKVSCKNLNKLAETLLFISYYDINDSPEDEEILFWDLILEYLDKVESKELIAACPDFINVHKQFVDESNNKDE